MTLIRELSLPSTVLRQLATRHPARYPVLLDSVAEGPLSRMSLLLAEPRAALWLDAEDRLGAEGMVPQGVTFFAALDHWWRQERQEEHRQTSAGPPYDTTRDHGAADADAPSFNGGWAIFLSYEMAQEVEPHLEIPRSPLAWKAFALRTPCALVHRRDDGRLFAVAEEGESSALDRLEADAQAAAAAGEAVAADPESGIDHIREEEPETYLERVRIGQEYIRAGDIYQTNLSRAWRVTLAQEPDVGTLYERLCKANPAPFAALAQWRGQTVLSSSPERLVRVQQRRIDTRPIAGTRPRSRQSGVDLIEMQALVSHPKERAEHIMLIDLERNDLGRVCEAGTVRVDELMSIESYAHVHHIVSNVTGVLRPEVSPVEAARAVFPGGTITGVPKFRCMQIIAELEGEGRGAYTGSLGFLTREGTLDLNILIRTMTLHGRQVEFRAGAGIVADSDPVRELEETRAKAKGMLAVFKSRT